MSSGFFLTALRPLRLAAVGLALVTVGLGASSVMVVVEVAAGGGGPPEEGNAGSSVAGGAVVVAGRFSMVQVRVRYGSNDRVRERDTTTRTRM